MPQSPLIKKLGIKPGQEMLILNAPDGYVETLGALPAGVKINTSAEGTFDFVQAFVHNRVDIDLYLPAAMRALKPGGQLWFAYPKKSSGIETDITRDKGWETVYDAGWQPVAQIAIDDTWTGFRFRPAAHVKSRRRD